MKLIVIVLLMCGSALGRPRSKKCPPTEPEVRCFVDPCMGAGPRCVKGQMEHCIANFCGGCNYVWVKTKPVEPC